MEFSRDVRNSAGYVVAFLHKLQTGISMMPENQKILQARREFLSTGDIAVRDIPGVIEFGFPNNVAKYLLDSEAKYMDNQLLYARFTAQENTREEHVNSAVSLLLTSMQSLVETIYSIHTPMEELIEMLFSCIDFPYMESFPILNFKCAETGLQWGLTFGLTKSEFTPFIPVIFVPYFGNVIVMCLPNFVSHGTGIVFKSPGAMRSAIASADETVATMGKEFADSQQLDMSKAKLSGAVGTNCRNEFFVLLTNPALNDNIPLEPVVSTMTNIILTSILNPVLVALQNSAQTTDEKRMLQMAATMVSTYTQACIKVGGVWGLDG